jgi:NAD(P)H-dependent FMN reductase
MTHLVYTPEFADSDYAGLVRRAELARAFCLVRVGPDDGNPATDYQSLLTGQPVQGEAGPDDLRWAHGILLGTPENFGYMSGQMKDFFDRSYYEVEGELDPLPCALFISCGNDGRGAVREIRRIVQGYPFNEVQDPVIIRGEITDEALERCTELGMALAAGLEAGIY